MAHSEENQSQTWTTTLDYVYQLTIVSHNLQYTLIFQQNKCKTTQKRPMLRICCVGWRVHIFTWGYVEVWSAALTRILFGICGFIVFFVLLGPATVAYPSHYTDDQRAGDEGKATEEEGGRVGACGVN
jgi:hypothetical protein